MRDGFPFFPALIYVDPGRSPTVVVWVIVVRSHQIAPTSQVWSMDESKGSVEIVESAPSDDTGTDVVQVYSAAEERKLVRKVDMHIMPVLCVMYLFACEYSSLCMPTQSSKVLLYLDLDRINLGNARLQRLPQDVLHGDPTGMLFDWVNSAFYFSYVRRFLPFVCAVSSDSCFPCRFYVRFRLYC